MQWSKIFQVSTVAGVFASGLLSGVLLTGTVVNGGAKPSAKEQQSAKALEDLIAKDQIREQIYNYARGLDRMDKALALQVWHPDGTADYLGQYKGLGSGFIEYAWKAHTNLIAHSHQMTNILIKVDGDKAVSETYLMASMRSEPAADKASTSLIRGRYADRWSRRNGHWAIDHRVMTIDFSTRDEATDRIGPASTGATGPTPPTRSISTDAVEFRTIWPDGGTHWIFGRAQVSYETDGAPLRLLGIGIDITARKTLEEQVQRAQRMEAIAQEARIKTAWLELQNARIQSASRFKSEFLANMSHELRTPLNAISGFTQLIHDGKVGPVSARQKEFLADILLSSQHLLQLINDILDLAKVESGKMDLRPQVVDLSSLVSDVCDISQGLAASKRLRVRIHIDHDMPAVTVDPGRVKQSCSTIYRTRSSSHRRTAP